MADSNFVAKRVDAGVPIWTIFAYGRDIGSATVFDWEDEGPMATVRYGYDDLPVTFSGSSIRDVLAKVGAFLRTIDSDMEGEAAAEYYSEVTGPMEAAERLAERGYRDDDPIW